MKRILILSGKALVSLVLLVWFFSQIDPWSVLEIFFQADFTWLFLALLAMIAGLLVSAYKWRKLLHRDGVDARLPDLMRYYLMGVYFNNFLPTSIGGDAMRVYLVARRYERSLPGVSSVLAERLSGLLALLVVAGCLSLNGKIFPQQQWLSLAIILLFLVASILVKAISREHLLRLVPSKVRFRIVELISSLDNYRADKRVLWTMGWTSLVYPLLVGLVYYFGGRAIGVHAQLLDLVVITSLVTLLTLIPISLNGLGIREGGFVFFLGQLGVPQAQALSLSLLVFGLTLMFSLVGGIFFLADQRYKA